MDRRPQKAQSLQMCSAVAAYTRCGRGIRAGENASSHSISTNTCTNEGSLFTLNPGPCRVRTTWSHSNSQLIPSSPMPRFSTPKPANQSHTSCAVSISSTTIGMIWNPSWRLGAEVLVLSQALSPLGLLDFFGGVWFDGERIRFGAVETNREPKNHKGGKGQPEYFDFHSERGNELTTGFVVRNLLLIRRGIGDCLGAPTGRAGSRSGAHRRRRSSGRSNSPGNQARRPSGCCALAKGTRNTEYCAATQPLVGSVSERRGVTREASRCARKAKGGYSDSLISVVASELRAERAQRNVRPQTVV